MVGNIGSEDRMNYTALGATVNLAARLEGLNKNYGDGPGQRGVKQRVEQRFVFRAVDRIRPKGFAEAFEIYELRGDRAGDGTAERAFCQRWEAVYAAIGREEAGEALKRISEFLGEYPGDGVAQYHAERLRATIPSAKLPETSRH